MHGQAEKQTVIEDPAKCFMQAMKHCAQEIHLTLSVNRVYFAFYNTFFQTCTFIRRRARAGLTLVQCDEWRRPAAIVRGVGPGLSVVNEGLFICIPQIKFISLSLSLSLSLSVLTVCHASSRFQKYDFRLQQNKNFKCKF